MFDNKHCKPRMKPREALRHLERGVGMTKLGRRQRVARNPHLLLLLTFGILLMNAANAWVWRPLLVPIQRHKEGLPMGGYYSEPLSPKDESLSSQKTHMIFGMQCREETVTLPNDDQKDPITLTLLLPLKENEGENASQPAQELVWEREVALASFLLQHSREEKPPGRLVVWEDGAHRTGLVSLAATTLPDATVVAVCSTEDQRLQRIQWSYNLFHASSSSSLETGKCSIL